MANYFGVLPIHILRNKTLTPLAKLLFMEITSRVGVNGKMRFTLHSLAMTFGVTHGVVKFNLNALAKAKLIWRIGEEISLAPPDEHESRQIEMNLEFVGEIIRKWNETFKADLPFGVVQSDILSGTINDALSVFSKDNLILAIDRWDRYCKNDKWWGDSSRTQIKTNISSFFKNIDRITQALNYKNSSSQIVIQRDEAEDSNLLK